MVSIASLVSILPILTPAIAILTAGVATGWAVFVFNKQQKYKRLQDLTKILQRFADKKEFIALFSLFDQSIEIGNDSSSKISYNELYLDKLKNENIENKLQFLVLLEEVALYATAFEVDREYAVHLFQWHFYYAYNDDKISDAFWTGLGGLVETNKPYWKYQKDFSRFCYPMLS